jgi:hypothetical protein
MPELATPVVLRFPAPSDGSLISVPATLHAVGEDARSQLTLQQSKPGLHLLLSGDRDYYVCVPSPLAKVTTTQLKAQVGRAVAVVFAGRPEVRRRLSQAIETLAQEKVSSANRYAADEQSVDAGQQSAALNLMSGIYGAQPLYLLPDGKLSLNPAEPTPTSIDLCDVFVATARWISSRRRSTFECLFPPSAFHPDLPTRSERMTAQQGAVLLTQVRDGLLAASVGGEGAVV